MKKDNQLIVIKKKGSEDGRKFIANRNDFEWQNLSECYDQFGQQIGEENAEDYCLENRYCTDLHKKFFNDLKAAGFEVEEENEIEDFTESDDEKVKKFVEAWRYDNESHNEALVYNFWNGHNWQSVILDCDIDEGADYKKVEDKEAGEILKAFEGVEFGQHERGLCSVEAGNFIFTHSLFAGDPFLANVI